ncbi:MAG: hypothetical protein KF830_00965 [Planctomycetes bacterium]|nr:hypothetical protein [Planctomycetota bacterium]
MTSYEDADLSGDPAVPAVAPVALTIPFGGAGSGDQWLLNEFCGGVLRRLQAAAEEGDPELVEALVGTYQRPGLPAPFAEALRGYEAVARGLRWQRHAAATAALALAGAPADGAAVPPLGAAFVVHLEVAPPPLPVRLGARGGEDPCGFAVTLAFHDTFVDGSTRSTRTQDFVWLPAPFEFEGEAPLVVPIGVDAAAGEAVRRVVHLRVDLMPGHARIDGRRAPVQRTTLASLALTQWPAGHEALARAPLQGLQEALRRGDPAHFPHVFVAAAFVTGDEREPAMALLVDRIRFGRPDQALVASVALREVAGIDLPPGDRDAWLAWWQARR